MNKKIKKIVLKIYKRYLRTLGYSKNISRYLFRIIQFGLYASIGLMGINIFGLITNNTNILGPFGDFFGGILNPILTFLMLIGLIFTILLQKIELALARSEFKRSSNALESQDKNLKYQRFENTFFKLIEFFEACRNEILYQRHIKADVITGRDAIKGIYNNFVYNYLHYNKPTDNALYGETKKTFREECKHIDGIKAKYGDFYAKEYGEDLGQYFRVLYNILKFINDNDGIDDKKVYTNLLRAQLSRYELSLLFYNCLSDFGEEKMMPLVKQYEILKHLEEKTLPVENIDIWHNFKA